MFCVARTNFIQRRAQDEHSHRTICSDRTICGGCTICDRAARSNERGESLCVQTSRCSEQPQNPIGSVKAFGAFGSFGEFGAFGSFGSFTAFDAFSAFGANGTKKTAGVFVTMFDSEIRSLRRESTSCHLANIVTLHSLAFDRSSTWRADMESV